MSNNSGTFTLGSKSVKRLGYGAMQLAGPGVFGPPKDRHVAITVLREALVLDVVNLRVMLGDGHGPAEGSIEANFTVLAELQQQGLVKHIGLSNVTPTQVAEARKIAEIVCVQNEYNIAHRADDALIDALARDGIAYVPFFPLGGFTPLQSSTLSDVAASLGATPMQVALAWLLQRSPNILLIPGTSSVGHLRENMAAGELSLSGDVLATLDSIAKNAG
jgi:pyridoxine 4-dehydrogenase